MTVMIGSLSTRKFPWPGHVAGTGVAYWVDGVSPATRATVHGPGRTLVAAGVLLPGGWRDFTWIPGGATVPGLNTLATGYETEDGANRGDQTWIGWTLS
jgi:hypothetical protein